MPVAKNFDREKWIKEQDKMIENFEKDIKDIAQNFKQSPEKIAEFLQFKSQFYSYSIRNTMLIQNQAPYSSLVASFEKWKERDANVLKGSKGIKIFVPVQTELYKLADDEKSHLVSKASEQIKQQIAQGKIKSYTKTSFKLGNVFDIGQTDYPKENYPKLFDLGLQSKDHAYLYEDLKDYATKKGFPVVEKNVESVALRGSYNLDTNEITISDKLNDTERLSTLTHELGHAIMHNASEDKGDKSKSVIEFEADCFSILLQTKMGVELTDMRKAHLTEHFKKLDTEIDIMETLQTANKVFVDFNNGFQAQPEQSKPIEEENTMELTQEKAQEMMSNFQKNNVDRGINDTKIRLKVGELTQEEAQEIMSKDNGNLNISGARITGLPDELEVKGNLNISFTKIKELPNGLKVNGNLKISGTNITELPEGLEVKGNLDIGSTKITELPKGLEVNGNIDISHTMITELPEGLEVKGNLDISSTKITELPEGLKVGGTLNLRNTGITQLPENLTVGGDLYLWGRGTKITKLPKGLKVGRNLDISSTDITELPEGLQVGDSFDLADTGITKLPENLTVGGYLNISNTRICEFRINELPENLQVGGGKIIALSQTQTQTHEELGKWYTKRDKWETEIAKRQKQQLPHSEEKQAAENEKPKPIELLIRTIPFEKDGSNVKGFAMVIINNSFCVKNIKILEGKNGLSVQMPSFKDIDGTLKDMAFAKTKEARDEMEFQILKEFENPSEKKIDKELISIKNDIKVSMELMSGDKAVKGIATITINEIYVIKRASIVEGKNGLFVQMPSYKKADGEYENIVFPIEKNAREQLNSAVLDKYNEAFKNQNEKTMQDYQAEIEAEKIEKAMEQQVEKQIIEEKSR